MGREYDVVVVGARCAGSPTAMLLARKGYRVLVVDRASFPSDTISTRVTVPDSGCHKILTSRPSVMPSSRNGSPV